MSWSMGISAIICLAFQTIFFIYIYIYIHYFWLIDILLYANIHKSKTHLRLQLPLCSIKVRHTTQSEGREMIQYRKAHFSSAEKAIFNSCFQKSSSD